jgi:hypothetical protein
MEALRPGIVARALPATFASPEADVEVRILQLAEALAVEAPELFADAVGWYRTALHFRGVADDYLSVSLEALATVLERELPSNNSGSYLRALTLAQQQAVAAPVVPPSPIEQASPFAERAQRFLLHTLEGNGDDAISRKWGACGCSARRRSPMSTSRASSRGRCLRCSRRAFLVSRLTHRTWSRSQSPATCTTSASASSRSVCSSRGSA